MSFLSSFKGLNSVNIRRYKYALLYIMIFLFLILSYGVKKKSENISGFLTWNYSSSTAILVTQEPQVMHYTIKETSTAVSSLDKQKPQVIHGNITDTRNHSSTATDIPSLVIQKPLMTLHNISNKMPNLPDVLNRDATYCEGIPDKDPPEVPPEWENRCPEKSVVTITQGGRLGNQIWEYVDVWAFAKITDRIPFAPSCLIQTLERVFKNLTEVLPLKYIEHCPIRYRYLLKTEHLEEEEGDIVLVPFAQLAYYIIPRLKEVRQLLQFHDHLTQKSQDILRRASKGLKDIVYVSVHARRTDYIRYLRVFFKSRPVTADFFLRQMDYFRQKYLKVLFVILSDDPDWCERELSANDALVVRGNSPEQDLSLLASCNHSILDYGTYGMWGATLAGGETRLYNVSFNVDAIMAKLMPNWHAVT